MKDNKIFIGRKKYLKKFEEFINTSSSDLEGQVLLIVGDQGMGKTSLLQAMAKKAFAQGHVVALGEIDKRQTEFSEQIYPVIAQIKAKPSLEIGSGSDWLKTTLTGFAIAASVTTGGATAALATGATGLATTLVDIRNRHKASGSSPSNLAQLFHYELDELDKTMGGAKRIIIFLDPEKESPEDIIPLLRHIAAREIPPRVRFIIAQRNEDSIIQAYENKDLRNICSIPIKLDLLTDDEEIDFINAYDKKGILYHDIREVLLSKFKGWPLLLDLAISQLLNFKGDINIDHVNSLPPDIDGFWKQRYEEIKDGNVLKLVQTVCLLPHPYSLDRLTRFTGLTASSIKAALHDQTVWGLLHSVTYEDTLSDSVSPECPYPKHTTAKDFVTGEIKKFKELKHEILSSILSHYKEILGDDLSGGKIDRDALVFLPVFLFNIGEFNDFLNKVSQLGSIKLRYGLLDSFMSDNHIALALNEELGRREGMANQYGNMGIVYQTRGDLDKALEMYGKSLAIEKELGRREGMASNYGNMGNVYQIRGDLDKALEMYGKSLAINEELGSREGMANQYGNMGNVYQIRGDLDKALEMCGKSLALSEELGRREGMASNYGNMGIVYQIRGDLDMALEMYGKSLAINEELGSREGMANQYGNMGNVYQIRGDLDKALEMYGKSLAINEELGSREGMANQYGNMGIVYRIRGDLDKALEMYGKSLAIEKELGRREGMASNYGNMGIVYQIRGDLDMALEMYGKSLALNEELGRREGMANQYGNMGIVYQIRGDLDMALEMYGKSLALNEELGRREGMANQYGNMGIVYQIRGDLDMALEMYGKSLALNEELGRREGMASQYGNMGTVYRIRGDLDKALEMCGKSLALSEELGRREGMAYNYCNMGIVYRIRGDLDKAEKAWMMCLQLFKAIGANDKIELIQGWLEDLKK